MLLPKAIKLGLWSTIMVWKIVIKFPIDLPWYSAQHIVSDLSHYKNLNHTWIHSTQQKINK